MMKKSIKLMTILAVVLAISCEKDDNDENGTDCFTCENCQGQYGHLLNGEYCVDGFDNRQDWQAMKNHRENEDGCDCEFD